MTPYLQFNRSQWAALRDSVPMTLTEVEIEETFGLDALLEGPIAVCGFEHGKRQIAALGLTGHPNPCLPE